MPKTGKDLRNYGWDASVNFRMRHALFLDLWALGVIGLSVNALVHGSSAGTCQWPRRAQPLITAISAPDSSRSEMPQHQQ